MIFDRRKYWDIIQSYINTDTPFILCDDEDDNFMAFIPSKLAGLGSDGVLMTYPDRGNFICAVGLHSAYFHGVKEPEENHKELIQKTLITVC